MNGTFKKLAPILLAGLSSIGVISTAVTAIMSTPKAEKIIEEEQAKKEGELTTLEKVKATWKCYVPTLVVGAGTIACVFGVHILDNKQQASLMGAYTVISQSYNKYKDTVKRVLGEEAHKKVMKELAVEKAKEVDIYAPSLTENLELGFDCPDDTPRLFYDSISERYFESTFLRVLNAEYHLNRNICLGMVVSANDFYDFLGLEHTDIGNNIFNSSDYVWIDFNHYKTTLDDGLECWVIEPVFPTYPPYMVE